jgi:hypothetical protein
MAQSSPATLSITRPLTRDEQFQLFRQSHSHLSEPELLEAWGKYIYQSNEKEEEETKNPTNRSTNQQLIDQFHLFRQDNPHMSEPDLLAAWQAYRYDSVHSNKKDEEQDSKKTMFPIGAMDADFLSTLAPADLQSLYQSKNLTVFDQVFLGIASNDQNNTEKKKRYDRFVDRKELALSIQIRMVEWFPTKELLRMIIDYVFPFTSVAERLVVFDTFCRQNDPDSMLFMDLWYHYYKLHKWIPQVDKSTHSNVSMDGKEQEQNKKMDVDSDRSDPESEQESDDTDIEHRSFKPEQPITTLTITAEEQFANCIRRGFTDCAEILWHQHVPQFEDRGSNNLDMEHFKKVFTPDEQIVLSNISESYNMRLAQKTNPYLFLNPVLCRKYFRHHYIESLLASKHYSTIEHVYHFFQSVTCKLGYARKTMLAMVSKAYRYPVKILKVAYICVYFNQLYKTQQYQLVTFRPCSGCYPNRTTGDNRQCHNCSEPRVDYCYGCLNMANRYVGVPTDLRPGFAVDGNQKDGVLGYNDHRGKRVRKLIHTCSRQALTRAGVETYNRIRHQFLLDRHCQQIIDSYGTMCRIFTVGSSHASFCPIHEPKFMKKTKTQNSSK